MRWPCNGHFLTGCSRSSRGAAGRRSAGGRSGDRDLKDDLRGQGAPQQIRASRTKVHFGGERPWFHCPQCHNRVARLYGGLGGYFCRACIGTIRPMRPSGSGPREGPFQGMETSPPSRWPRAAFASVSGAPAPYASADLRPAQARGHQPGGRVVEAVAEAIPGLPDPSCWHRLRINGEINCKSDRLQQRPSLGFMG